MWKVYRRQTTDYRRQTTDNRRQVKAIVHLDQGPGELKTDRHDILVTEILLKVALNTIKQTVCRRILPIESTFAYNSILIYIYPWYIKIIEFNKLCFYYIICIAIKDM